jgi:hypothetical protein
MMNPVDALAFSAILLLCLWLGDGLYRRFRPIPQKDLAAITLFLANRDQTPLRIRGGRGGPDARIQEPVYRQRLYKVLALDADGSRYRHVVAAVDHYADTKFALWQRVRGDWSQVLQ